MKAVRAVEGGVAVVDVEEAPGTGELLDMRSTSVCASDLSYIRWGFRKILGHGEAHLVTRSLVRHRARTLRRA